jgi:hypothetical protein
VECSHSPNTGDTGLPSPQAASTDNPVCDISLPPIAGSPSQPTPFATSPGPEQMDLRSRSDIISAALRTGEEIFAMHRRIMYNEHGNRNELACQVRLSNVLSGELLFKLVQFVKQVRETKTILDNAERVHMDRFLQ